MSFWRTPMLLVLLLAAGTAGAQVRNLERGRALYENHCRVCHTPKVHHRMPRLPLNQAQLREIVVLWSSGENLRWGEEEIDDVVFFLNMTVYHF